MSFQADELFGPTTAGEEWVRQHGRSTDAEVVSLGWTLIEDANEGAEFGGTIGALGDALERGDVGRGVVANADGADPLVPGEPIHREAALTLADSSGATACGEVGPTILTVDDTAPFGVRLDQVAVMEAFDRCSTPDSVVMVEASDLRRALAFRPRATPELAESARAQALASTDALAGAILERLDPERDAVVVVAPTTQPTHGLGVLGIHASEFEPGFLTSGNTRRAGYVLLTDLTPTIANLAGVELDEASMEGRAVERRDGPATGAARRAELVDAEAAARFRDRVLYPVVMTVVISVGLLALAAAAVLISRWDEVRPWLARVALVLLAFPSLTYLAAVFPFYEWGVAAYWLFLVLGSLLVGVLASMFAGRWLGPLAVGYGLLVGVVTVSIVGLGSRLQLATVFGDSPIVAGRFTGINNVTFAYYFLSATMLACIVVDRIPGRPRTQPDARDPRRRAPDRRGTHVGSRRGRCAGGLAGARARRDGLGAVEGAVAGGGAGRRRHPRADRCPRCPRPDARQRRSLASRPPLRADRQRWLVGALHGRRAQAGREPAVADREHLALPLRPARHRGGADAVAGSGLGPGRHRRLPAPAPGHARADRARRPRLRSQRLRHRRAGRHAGRRRPGRRVPGVPRRADTVP